MHVEFLVEEESCAEALRILAPKILGQEASFDTHPFQGKKDLLTSLPVRLRGYARWLPADWRVVVLVDRDADDCADLKQQLEMAARNAGLVTRTACGARGPFRVLNRIAVEELEAWFFGDVDAIVAAFHGVPATLGAKRGLRDPDAIAGGTWQRLEQVLKRAGYYAAGMPKIGVARRISRHMDPARNRSRSFQAFCAGIRSL